MTSTLSQAQQASSVPLFGGLTSFGKNFTEKLSSTALGNVNVNLEALVSGVKNLMPVNKYLTITKIVESIMDPPAATPSAIGMTENYLYFDPRSAHARGTPGAPAQPVSRPGTSTGSGAQPSFGQRRQGYNEAIVFTIGGGSMNEYGNLQEWVKRTSGQGGQAGGLSTAMKTRRVVYGSTDLVNGEDFLSQLVRLGQDG